MEAVLHSQSAESAATAAMVGWLVGLLLFFLFFLFAVNWQRLWPVLQEGGAIPLSLLLILVALVWSQIAPGDVVLFGGVLLGNFWWQLVVVGLVACVALFAGWLQDRYGWYPPEFAVEPQDGHGHDHHSEHHDASAGAAHGEAHAVAGHAH